MSELQGKVLLVNNHGTPQKAIVGALRHVALDLHHVCTGGEALNIVRTARYDAVLLDILPESDGIDTCRQLRQLRPQLGIVVVTAQDTEEMIIQALDAGADDYITQPFHIGEFAARLRSVIRRSRVFQDRRDLLIVIGEIELDPKRRTVTRSGKEIHLTPKEFDLLRYLMANAGFPLSHSRLLSAVWGVQYGHEVEYLRTFVRQLRKKLEDNAAEPQYLLTIPYVGYRFRSNLEGNSTSDDLARAPGNGWAENGDL